MYASKSDSIKILIDAGADPKTRDLETNTVLMREYLEPEAVKLLINAGVDVNDQNKNGQTSLMFAEKADYIKALIDVGADPKKTDFYDATVLMRKYLEPEAVKLLINTGIDVNAKDHFGKTALMFAEKADYIKALIDAGADPKAKDNFGKTALDYAKTDEIKQILQEAMKKSQQTN